MGELRKLCGVVVAVAVAAAAWGQFLPVREVRPGMKGVGKTVFSGSRVEEFQVEILGVLENVGPKQSIILGRLSGGPLERTGVMQGMSGSPVYIGGKLIGAVALAFPFAKEPIAGIRPIEEMLASPRGSAPEPPGAGRTEVNAGGLKLVELATPLALGGFTVGAFEHFAPRLRAMGLDPVQGALGGQGGSTPAQRIEPGSMISVQLVTGDLSLSADGTVTYLDGTRVYAFGHRMLALGPTALPFARSEVVALLANQNVSFKIASAREWLGAITEDRTAAVSGQLGLRPPMLPVSITIRDRRGNAPQQFALEVVRDRALTPLFTQMAVYSVLESTLRTAGPASVVVKGQLRLANLPPVLLDNAYSSEQSTPALAAIYTTLPLTYLLQAGLDNVRPERLELDVELSDRRRQYQVDQLWTPRREWRAGETVELKLTLAGENGEELARTVRFRLPPGMPPGTINVTVADGLTASFSELQGAVGVKSRTPEQLVGLLNRLRPNQQLSVRLWRSEAGVQVQGQELPGTPPSVGLVLGRAQQANAQSAIYRGTTVAEQFVDLGPVVAAGAKTITFEVKE
jgi:hypothetical protein